MDRTPSADQDRTVAGSRRSFLLSIGAAASAGVLLPTLQGCELAIPAGLAPSAANDTKGGDATGTDALAADTASADSVGPADVPASADASATTDGAAVSETATPADVPATPDVAAPKCPGPAVATPIGTFDLADPKYADLATIGKFVPFDAGADKLVLIRTAECTVIGLSRTCTHDACDMGPGDAGKWDNKLLRLKCLCHQSEFSVTGAVVKGPATKPLKLYQVSFDGDKGAVAK
ncbi:MAG: hypothetical protein EXR79_05650 [Myxococcales bacterium]|nr:hypothetical protein [Myxococcales bacterium]